MPRTISCLLLCAWLVLGAVIPAVAAAGPSFISLSCPGLLANFTATAQAKLVLDGVPTCATNLLAVNLTLPNGTSWYYNYQSVDAGKAPNDPTPPSCGGAGLHAFRVFALANGNYRLNASYSAGGFDVMNTCSFASAGVRSSAKVPEIPASLFIAVGVLAALWARKRNQSSTTSLGENELK